MAKQMLSLCSLPNVATRDGHAGGGAHFYLPFYGLWWASGQTYTFQGSTVLQDKSRHIGGLNMPNVFRKDCCGCCPASGLVTEDMVGGPT